MQGRFLWDTQPFWNRGIYYRPFSPPDMASPVFGILDFSFHCSGGCLSHRKTHLKLKGYFLAIATLGSEKFFKLLSGSPPLDGGVIGIFDIPFLAVGGFTFDTYLKQYYLTWGLLLGLFLYSKNLVRSRWAGPF